MSNIAWTVSSCCGDKNSGVLTKNRVNAYCGRLSIVHLYVSPYETM